MASLNRNNRAIRAVDPVVEPEGGARHAQSHRGALQRVIAPLADPQGWNGRLPREVYEGVVARVCWAWRCVRYIGVKALSATDTLSRALHPGAISEAKLAVQDTLLTASTKREGLVKYLQDLPWGVMSRGARGEAETLRARIEGECAMRVYQLFPHPSWKGAGYGIPFTARDGAVKSDPMLEDDVVYMHDVYEYDLSTRFTDHVHIVSYMLPSGAGGKTSSGVYGWDRKNALVYRTEGSVWRGRVWDFETLDTVVCAGGLWLYLVRLHNILLSPTRRVTIMEPVKKCLRYFGVFNSYSWLTRLTPYDATTGVVIRHNLSGFSLAYPEADYSVEITDSQVGTICSYNDKEVWMSTILNVLGKKNEDGAHIAALVKAALPKLREMTGVKPFPIAYANEDPYNLHYFCGTDPQGEVAKLYARVILPRYNWLPGYVFCPVISHANELQAYEGRIESVENNEPFPRKYALAREVFKNRIADLVGLLLPKDQSEALADLRPRQQQRYIKAGSQGHAGKNYHVSAFVKKESYATPNDPRLIQPMNDEHVSEFGTFVSVFARALKAKCRWYAFGNSPEQIAVRVKHIARGGRPLLASDFSRFDGRVSRAMIEFEIEMFKAVFPSRYHETIVRLKKACFGCKVTTPNGVKWQSKWARLSGVSDTSFSNGLQNGFMAYIAYCESRITSIDEWEDGARLLELLLEWEEEGIYGGDDGLTAGVEAKCFNDVAAAFGCVTKCTLHSKNVPFLARVWPDPSLDLGSVPDEPRLLAKLHVTVAPPDVPVEVCVMRRLLALYEADKGSDWLDPYAHLFQLYLHELRGCANDTYARLSEKYADFEPTAVERQYWSPDGAPWPSPHITLLETYSTPERGAWVQAVLNSNSVAEALSHRYPHNLEAGVLSKLKRVVYKGFNVERGQFLPGSDNIH
jgi:hypothetical protein